MWLQISTFAVIIWNETAKCWKLQSCDCNFQNVKEIFQNLQSRDCNFWNMVQNSKSNSKIHKYDGEFKKITASLKKMHLRGIFGEIWPQLSTFYSHISNYDCNFQHFAATVRIMTANFNIFSLFSNYDCKMLKVAVIIWNFEICNLMTATFEICSYVTETFYILQS